MNGEIVEAIPAEIDLATRAHRDGRRAQREPRIEHALRERRDGVDFDLRRSQALDDAADGKSRRGLRSEEHTSELQSLMRISYAVFCLKKTNIKQAQLHTRRHTPTKKLHTL